MPHSQELGFMWLPAAALRYHTLLFVWNFEFTWKWDRRRNCTHASSNWRKKACKTAKRAVKIWLRNMTQKWLRNMYFDFRNRYRKERIGRIGESMRYKHTLHLVYTYISWSYWLAVMADFGRQKAETPSKTFPIYSQSVSADTCTFSFLLY